VAGIGLNPSTLRLVASSRSKLTIRSGKLEPMSPRFFARAELFRNWLAKNHQTHRELLVGYYKQGSGRETMTWSASVDETLCFGWIDGMRKRIDESSYSIRFTPRKKTSVWSSINVAKVEVLLAAGRMLPAGLAAFEQRVDSRSGIYSYEQTTAEIDER
jgi:uncharacterized protein YdeI (YjbR/CyaY-like superfamily)